MGRLTYLSSAAITTAVSVVPLTLCRCGIRYPHNADGIRRHRTIQGHTPTPDTPPRPAEPAAPIPPSSRKKGSDGLTPRQRQILTLHQQGHGPQAIGAALGVTDSCVSTTLSRLRKKGVIE